MVAFLIDSVSLVLLLLFLLDSEEHDYLFVLDSDQKNHLFLLDFHSMSVCFFLTFIA